MRSSNLLFAAAGLVAGATLTLTTVGYTAPAVSADQGNNAMKMAQKAQVMAVTFQLDTSGLHDIDVSLAAGTMPAYGSQLSEADRWHVINYVRGFAPQTE